MDIKTRIDKLSEQDAKAALYCVIRAGAVDIATPFENELTYGEKLKKINRIMEGLLAVALKEARK